MLWDVFRKTDPDPGKDTVTVLIKKKKEAQVKKVTEYIKM